MLWKLQGTIQLLLPGWNAPQWLPRHTICNREGWEGGWSRGDTPQPGSVEILAGRGTRGTCSWWITQTCQPGETGGVQLLSQQAWWNCSPQMNSVHCNLILILISIQSYQTPRKDHLSLNMCSIFFWTVFLRVKQDNFTALSNKGI